MTTRRLFLAAFSAFGLAAVAPTAASAFAPVWQTPSVASDAGPDTAWPHLASGADGSVTVFWQQSDGINPRTFANTRSAQGVWSGAEALGSADETAAYGPGYIVAAAGDGSLSAGWMKADYSGFVMAVKQPGGNWHSSTSTADDGEFFMSAAMVAGPDNSTMLLTSGGVGADHKLRLRQRLAGSDAFTVIDEIDQPNDEDQHIADLAFNSNGDAVAGWKADTSGDDEVRVAQYDGQTHSFISESVHTVATDAAGVGGGVKVAINDDGDAAVVWGNASYTGLHAAAMQASTTQGAPGTWSGPDSLLVAGPNVVPGRVAADDDGNFVTVWQELNFGAPTTTSHAYASTHPRGGSWSPVEDIAGGEIAGATDLAANADGDMVASLYTGIGSTPTMAVAYRASGSTAFEPIQAAKSGNVTGDGTVGVPVVAIDPRGNAAVAFPQIDGSSIVTGFAGGDGSAPQAGALTLSASSAMVGQTVSASSGTAFDLWSGVGATTYDFGDGATAATTEDGTVIPNAAKYTTPGTKTVTATTTDLAGFSTVVTENIEITRPNVVQPQPPVVTKLPPVIEARLSGKKVTLNVKVTLRAGKKCNDRERGVTATTAFGKVTYRTTLKLALKDGVCRGTGVITLRKTPGARTKLKVVIGGKSSKKDRSLSTKRG